MRRTLIVASVFAVATSCGRADETSDPVAIVRGHAVFRDLGGGRFSPTSGGFRASAAALRAELPTRAIDPIRLSASRDATAWIAVTAIGLRAVPGELRGEALVYPRAADDTDVVWLTKAGAVEELRVVGHTSERIVARYSIAHGPGLASLRSNGAIVEASDASGRVVLATRPAFVVDAVGHRRDMTVALAGERLEFSADGTDLVPPIVIDPTWVSTATSLSVPHGFGHTTTLLPSGKVLLAGGKDAAGNPISEAELWDPATNKWTATSAMSNKREGHSAFLHAGKAMICGGFTGSPILQTCESFDPATETWSLASGFNARRTYHVLADLGGGNYLAAGGYDVTGYISTAEMFDATSESWSTVPAMSVVRGEGAGVRVGTKALIIGGRNGLPLNKVEVFDPATKTWSAGVNMLSPRSDFATTVLPDGRIFVAGGNSDTGLTSLSEIYDPSTSKWTAGPALSNANVAFGAKLPGGAMVVVLGTDAVRLFDSQTNTLIAAPSLPTSNGPGLTALGGGKVLAAGLAFTSMMESTSELYSSNPDGATCAKSVECASGHCVSGTCCPSTAPCMGGSDAGMDSTPDATPDTTPDAATDGPGPTGKDDGAACSAASECTSGFCVDGLCCNVACDGQCQACDLPGKTGTCAIVSGAPHGARTACGDGSSCAGKCDGIDSQKCVYPTAGDSCGTACEGDGIATKTCDGKGACVTQATSSCTPYVCQGGACATSCSKNADCAPDTICSEGACVAATPANADSGGCGCGIPSTRGTRAALMTGLLALVIGIMRRRR